MVKLSLATCTVRTWERTDADSLAHHANNRKIWRNLRDLFPSPYTADDARRFIDMALEMDPETYFAVEVDGTACGSIGYRVGTDVERCSAEIGCWLGEEYWGRGIMTDALAAVTKHAIETHDLTRVFAVPYAWNGASSRILEKAGYLFEGRMRCSAIKDGEVTDQLLYAYVGDKWRHASD